MKVHQPKSSTTFFVAMLLAGALAAGEVAADGGAAHRASLSRPIPLGVSGGSRVDQDGAFCCGGTLGALLTDAAGNAYVLSNNHVLGRTNRAASGEDTVQPGLIDSGCSAGVASVVADFTNLIPISFDAPNRVDAAIARARAGQVDTAGTVLDIGAPSASVREAAVGMLVQKSGRTTGLTDGQVIGVNATVNVSYPKKCGGGGGPAALMEDQFLISTGTFSAGGDSGSVIFDTSSPAQAVGLLFAGSASYTIANRIQNVLGAAWSVGPLAIAGGTVSGCTSDADCADADACTIDTCAAGVCQHAPIICNDGNACTTDSCSAGSCVFDPIECDDDDPCTTDGCNAASGCFADPIPGCADPCGDGVCDVSAGESCTSCAADCNGQTRGKPSNRFCCGADVGCSDSRCTAGGACVAGAVSGQPPRGKVGLARAAEAKHRGAARLMSIPDAVGHGIGVTANGSAVIEVYLARDSAAARAKMPAGLHGVPVRARVTGQFVAY